MKTAQRLSTSKQYILLNPLTQMRFDFIYYLIYFCYILNFVFLQPFYKVVKTFKLLLSDNAVLTLCYFIGKVSYLIDLSSSVSRRVTSSRWCRWLKGDGGRECTTEPLGGFQATTSLRYLQEVCLSSLSHITLVKCNGFAVILMSLLSLDCMFVSYDLYHLSKLCNYYLIFTYIKGIK